MRKIALTVAAIGAALTLTACGSGDSYTFEQFQGDLASSMHLNGKAGKTESANAKVILDASCKSDGGQSYKDLLDGLAQLSSLGSVFESIGDNPVNMTEPPDLERAHASVDRYCRANV